MNIVKGSFNLHLLIVFSSFYNMLIIILNQLSWVYLSHKKQIKEEKITRWTAFHKVQATRAQSPRQPTEKQRDSLIPINLLQRRNILNEWESSKQDACSGRGLEYSCGYWPFVSMWTSEHLSLASYPSYFQSIYRIWYSKELVLTHVHGVLSSPSLTIC